MLKYIDTLGKYLSKALQKYYYRKGNRIVFSNHLSLNRLALAMWEKLNYKSVDPSVITRVLQGKRTFNYQQLNVFASLLKLSASEKKQLSESLNLDLVQKFGLDKDFFIPDYKYLLESIDDNLKKIEEIRLKGLFSLAWEWLKLLNDRILREHPNLNNIKGKALLRRLPYVWVDQMHITFSLNLADQVLNDCQYLYQKVKPLIREFRNQTLLSTADCRLGDALEVAGNYPAAINYVKASLPFTRNDYDKYMNLRVLALSFARLGQELEYQRIRKLILPGQSHPDQLITFHVQECLTRSDATFNHPSDAYRHLSLLKSIQRLSFPSPSRESQVIKVEAELGLEFDKNSDYLTRISHKGLELANLAGHTRYRDFFKSYLEK